MVIDALTLQMVDFELRVVLPQPLQRPGADVSPIGEVESNQVLTVQAGKIEVRSFGREGQDDAEARGVPSKLRQQINLHSFACGVRIEGREGGVVSYPLVDRFSYTADMSRIGERFGGFLAGMEVTGLGQPLDFCPDLASITGSGLAVHMGSVQVACLMQLSVMVLAPPDPNAEDSTVEDGADDVSPGSDSNVSDENDPSTFHFPLASATLVLFEETHIEASGISMRYKADGTVCIAEVAAMEYQSSDNGQATASQLTLTVRPNVKLTVGCIDKLHIPNSFALSKPIRSSEIIYQGSTVVVRLDELGIHTFPKETTQSSSTIISPPRLPCNINLSIRKGMEIKKSETGSLTKFGQFNLYALKEKDCTKLAVQCESLRNYLVSLNTVSFCGSLPLTQVNTVNDFIFTAGDITVKSGYSTDEWEDAFRPRKLKSQQSSVKSKASEKAKAAIKTSHVKMKASEKAKASEKSKAEIKMPYANIADVNVSISLESSYKIGKVKDTKLVIKAFKGRSDTTMKDVVNYYTKACLSRVPDFISNAEVLGLNIVDSTAGMLSTWAGMGIMGSLGAGAGVAAITAVDAVKGAVDAGKRSRNASEAADTKPGDFFRGLVQAAGEATSAGAAKRGRSPNEKGNLIDWTVGATENTTEYVVENKNRLGAAGAGGGGFLLGMALGGPIGAVVGGLVATATTGAALEQLDERGGLIKAPNEKNKSKQK
jgi:hypothetical protein